MESEGCDVSGIAHYLIQRGNYHLEVGLFKTTGLEFVFVGRPGKRNGKGALSLVLQMLKDK